MPDTYVNVYAISRLYGGPEEGGWYYDAGQPVTSVRVEFTDAERAAIHDLILTTLKASAETVDPNQYDVSWKRAVELQAEHIADHLGERFPDTGASSSVLGGEDYRIMVEDHYGEAWNNYQPWE